MLMLCAGPRGDAVQSALRGILLYTHLLPSRFRKFSLSPRVPIRRNGSHALRSSSIASPMEDVF